jgi:ABC-2 type transport system ATP-binding protein
LISLDDPANGLDPAGVVEIRELLSALAREQGKTIFMSSHILSEVDRLATRIGIIHNGKMLAELDADKLEALRKKRLEIQTRDHVHALEVLSRAGYSPSVEDESILLIDSRALEHPDEVATLLVGANVAPTRLAVEQENLEDYFLRLTRDA